jgi:hypothetical protein
MSFIEKLLKIFMPWKSSKWVMWKAYEKNNNAVDGTEFIGLSLEECRKCKLTSNGIEYNGDFYKMTASAASSMAMLFQHLDLN